MKVRGQAKRIKPTYTRSVEIPERFASIFWDESQGKTILEKFILRILNYGNFEEIKWVHDNYPDETYEIAMRYPDIKRGVRFWIRLWKERRSKG